MATSAEFLTYVNRALKLLKEGAYDQIDPEDTSFTDPGELEVIATLTDVQAAMQEVCRQANVIAEGDYTAEIAPRSDTDELGLALLNMTKTLREVAQVAEAVSVGDYCAQVEVKGEQDKLAASINLMVGNLQEVCRQAKVIAAGDYSAEIAPRSDKDELGIALFNMTRKLQEREAGLLKATALLEERNKDLETLLYVTSHDLREPLRTLQNFSRLVNDRYADKLDEKGQDFLRRIVRGADRLDLLVEDVLTLSRAQRLVKPNQWLEARTIVDDALGRLQSKIRQSGAEVRVADELPRLYVDQMWATQAVYNLAANALKFTREGQPPEVEIDAYHPRAGVGSVGIVVRDRGPGVDAEYRERIFDLFKRAVDREVEGTGAGLAIVRQIARRHDGNVWVEDRQGGGSQFIITFGVSKAKERQDDPGETRTDRDLVGGRQR